MLRLPTSAADLSNWRWLGKRRVGDLQSKLEIQRYSGGKREGETARERERE
jgi:hypothetical protein